MRRIHIAMMALGLVAVLGVTLVQATAQPAPSPYGVRKDDPKAPAKGKDGPTVPLIPPAAPAADVVLPPLPSGPEISLPPVIADVTAPADVKPMLPPSPGIELKPVFGPPPVIKNGNTPEPIKMEPPKPAVAKPAFADLGPAVPPMVSPLVAPTFTPPAAPAVVGANRVTPNVTLETVVPDAVPLGKDVAYEIVVKNAGPMAVSGVKVEEELPVGARYLSGEPLAEVSATTLAWSLGELPAGAEKRLKVTVKPAGEGDYRTSPKVTFTATAANTIKITNGLGPDANAPPGSAPELAGKTGPPAPSTPVAPNAA